MKTNKKVWIFSLIAMFTILAIINLNAQEKENGIMKVPKKGEGINKGIVVAFGKKIQKPYFVTWDDGKILINGITFTPREKDSIKEKKDVIVTEMDKKKHELIENVENNYLKYYNSEGELKAKEKIQEEYCSHSIISKFEFKNDILNLEFNDGSEINIMLNTFVMESQKIYPTEEEILSQRKEEIEKIKSFLKQKWMIAFGYDYTMYIPPKERQRIESIVKNIKDGSLSAINGKDEIIDITKKLEFSEDILENISLWRIK